MSEPGAVRQSVLFPEQGIPPAKAKAIRDRYLLEDDWYQEGRVIWIRPSGVQRLAIAEEEPRLAQKFVDLEVLHEAKNPRYVMCRLAGESQKIPCLIPRRFKAWQFRRKTIRAEEVVDANGGRHYRHEALAES